MRRPAARAATLPRIRSRLAAVLVAALTAATPFGSSLEAAELRVIEGCTLVPAEWADGDSFRVRLPDGGELTIRLYGADCIEDRITDANDARRLRSQRRYFGITRVKPDSAAAIAFARDFGRQGTEEARAFLARPFTIHTSFADARGDARFERVYAFVFDADGRDLSAHLVSRGLARAFGVSRSTLAGESAEGYREMLRDLELRAAAAGVGVWAHTDWDALPDERKLEREEAREIQEAVGTARLPDGTVLEINSASRGDLMRLPGIGETLANRIIEKRPYARLTELLEVDGIGPATYRRLKPLLRVDPQPSEE